MELSELQKEQVRYYCGYGMLGEQINPANGYRYFTRYGILEYKLIHLQEFEYLKITTEFLVQLPLLEGDIYGVTGARQNLDTKQAAVWTWNDKEIRDRKYLYNSRRLDLCNFLGIVPGSFFNGNSGIRSIGMCI